MGTFFQWPFKRKQYPGINNPRFVSDIVAATEAVIDGLISITGLGPTDFAIINGLQFTTGTPNTYTPGVFYLNGSFYYIGTAFSEGLYLTGTTVDTMPQPFDDAVSRNIYTLMVGNSTVVSTGASPIFSGNMNQYRLDLKSLKAKTLDIETILGNLENPAFSIFGTTAGTVAAGDDARFGYSKSDIDTYFAKKVAVLLLSPDPSFTFTPTGDYQPATKKYVDDATSLKVKKSDTLIVGNIPNTGITKTISLGITLPSTNYKVTGSIISLGTPSNDATVGWAIPASSKTTTSFDVEFVEFSGVDQNINFDWILFQ